MDSARTALRGGAECTIVYRRSRQEMPARDEEIHHAEEEGIVFKLLTNPKRILGDEFGRVTGIECLKMKLGEPDESGRRRPIEIEGSNFRIKIDILIPSIGQTPEFSLIKEAEKNLKYNKWGYAEYDESIELLKKLYSQLEDTEVKEDLVTAVGVHDNNAKGYDFLNDMIFSKEDDEISEQAVFWIAQPYKDIFDPHIRVVYSVCSISAPH